MRIGYFESRDEDVRGLRSVLRAHDVDWIPSHLTAESADRAASCEAISVSIASQLTRRMLSRLPALRFVTTRSTGFDHIDLAACNERGVQVANVPGYGEQTVAEHTLGLILALTRRIVAGHARTQAREFSIDGLEGVDLAGRTIGIVGLGRIGSRVASLAGAFRLRVLAHDPQVPDEHARRLGAELVPFSQVLAHGDVVTLHLSLSEATRHLIDDRALAQAKRGALLVNTARGELVDTGAAVRALDRGTLGGAAFDVLEGEGAIREEAELLERSPSPHFGRVLLETFSLLDRPNVIVTPHIAFYSRESIAHILDVTGRNLLAFAAGTPENLVR